MAINILSAFEIKPKELDFIWPGFLAGSVGSLVSPGGAGKSIFALLGSMAVASMETSGDLLEINPKHHGQVIYFAAEDPEPVLVHRLYHIGQFLHPVAREAVAQNLVIEPILGKRLNILNDQHLSRIVEYCTGARLVVFDTLSRIHQLDENSNSDMAQVVSAFEYLVAQTGAAVLFLHHLNKQSMREGDTGQQHAARGASALVDNVRWCGFLSRMTAAEAAKVGVTEDQRHYYVRYGISKQNYAVIPPDRWYERCEGGVLRPIDFFDTQSIENTNNKNRKRKRKQREQG